jgi:GWxTD domain-containing protein
VLLAAVLCAGALALDGCASWSRVGTPETEPGPAEQLPQLFEPTAVYRQMGLIAESGPLPIVGTMRVLAGPSPDTLLALVALSLRNRGLTFRREAASFLAEYRVEIVLRREGAVAAQLARDEEVRVATFRETQRTDESIIFQQFLPVTPGPYVLGLSVRDRSGPNAARIEVPFLVPALGSARVALPIAVYTAEPRTSLAQAPQLVTNPRSSVAYGVDTLRFYLETYGLERGRFIVASATDIGGRLAWTDTISADSTRALASHLLEIPPQSLSIGRYALTLRVSGGDSAVAPFLVTFSDQYAAANLQEIVSLLRYFPAADSLRAGLNAPEADRSAAWRRFWERSDPNPATPENEALDDYLARIQVANLRFREEGIPGWLTERGEVFITLGEPDEQIDRRPDIQGRGRFIIWTYQELRLSLTFVDDTGFGRFRLEPRSRAEYLRVLNRVRRSQ